ncbi:ABC transporter ATP-binding protein [Actibacterium sp. D379-3]
MPLLNFENLQVDFATPDGTAHAVRGVDLSVKQGEILGIVGESGSGKSVLFLAALGLLARSARVSGRAVFDGDDLISLPDERLNSFRGRRIAMVFQDPMSSLNPVQTVGHQLGEAIRMHKAHGAGGGYTPQSLLAEVGLNDPQRQLRAYPHQLSGGQSQRVMLAMMLAGDPDLLIADEPSTALDVTVQAQILELLRSICRDRGTTIVLISHDFGVVAQICDRVAVMYAGRVAELAPIDTLFDQARHPYTIGLLGSRPRDGQGDRLTPIEGAVPSALSAIAGCTFAPRCPRRMTECAQTVVRSGNETHWYYCQNPMNVGRCS